MSRDLAKKNAQSRQWYAENRVDILARRREQRLGKGPRPYTPQPKEQRRAAYIKWAYGITAEEHDKMLSDQGYCCAICGVEDWSSLHGRLYVDHDHKTGEVRGLLCNNCNSGLGHFMDDRNRLAGAIAYLEASDV